MTVYYFYCLISVWDLEKDCLSWNCTCDKCIWTLQMTFVISIFKWQMLTQYVFVPLGARKILAIVIIEKDRLIIYK